MILGEFKGSLIYIRLLSWIVLSVSCVSQVAAAISTDRDSLYHHISHGLYASHSCRFVYEQGSGVISSNLGDNAAELDKLSDFIRQAFAHPDYTVSRILLTGYSSIEGDYAHNEALSRERVEYFHAYLQVRHPELYRYPHNVAWVAEDWQGLSKLVRNSNLNERDEILEIIRKVRVYDDREALLMKLNGGHAYHIMKRTMFSQLRRVELQVEYKQAPKAEVASGDPLIYKVLEKDTVDFRNNRSLALANATTIQEPTTSPQPTPKEREYKATVARSDPHGIHPLQGGGAQRAEGVDAKFAIKTNVLLWVGIQHDFKHTSPVANVALEYYINPCFSIELGAMYSYWRYNSNQEFQGISGYRLEPRYNFSFLLSNRLGAYLGIYGRVGDYDIRSYKSLDAHGDPEVIPCHTGDYWDAGLSAGINIKLVGQFALEVGARAGYVSTNVIKYMQDNQYNWYESEQKYNKFKITDLNVSLVYRFR